MPDVHAARLNLVSLNTMGIPVRGSLLAERYAVITGTLDASDADVVCLQEVVTWWHLRTLARQMPSYPYVSVRPSLPGPAGGLVTFSRIPVSDTAYRGFGVPPRLPGVPQSIRLRAALKGALVTQLADPGLAVVNVHPVASRDGDWSRTGRFYELHRAQLGALAAVALAVKVPLAVCGDFNVDRDSGLFGDFAESTGLADAFEGTCPPTFRREYLPAGEAPHCIDFILTGPGLKAESAAVVFGGADDLASGPGHVSDHVGLSACLFLTPP